MKQLFVSMVLSLVSLQSFAQEPIYFNNLFNPENTWAQGRGILQIEDYYYGIFGTKLYPASNYKIAVFKMDLLGNVVDWNTIGENWHHYFMGIIGGILIETNDGNLAFATHIQDTVYAHGVLIKLNLELDTIWKREYHSESTSPRTWNVRQTSDGGYIMVGIDYPGGVYYDALLIKANSAGEEQWRQVYGVGSIYSEYLTNVIETADGGYLIGGHRTESAYYDHTLDAMVMKTDSLGNEEWTNYYGNPDVDDDKAHVILADDGNYLIASVYGEWVIGENSRTGRIMLVKIDSEGNTIWQKKIGPKDRNVYLNQLSRTLDDNLIVAGWAYNDTISEFIYEGLLYKFSQEGDSIWMRDYYYFEEQYDWNYFYDVFPTSDNGYVVTGWGKQLFGGNDSLWIVKVDSMGCDTPGCATGVQVFDMPYLFNKAIAVWPNPTSGWLNIEFLNTIKGLKLQGETLIRIYDSQGIKVKKVNLPQNTELHVIDVSGLKDGFYYLQFINSKKVAGTAKFIKN